MTKFNEMSREEAIALLQAAEAKALTEKAQEGLPFTMKVSEEKKVLSLYRLTVRGVHMYAAAWVKVLVNADVVLRFIQSNIETLAFKNVEQKQECIRLINKHFGEEQETNTPTILRKAA